MIAPFVADPDFTLYIGDALDVLRELPDESVHCVVTSPPYWGLRDYGVDGQLGLEPSPDEYVARMVAVFREVRRVLRADGTCWLNLGDSYAGSWGAQSRENPGEQGASNLGGGSMLSVRQIAAHPKTTLTGSLKNIPGLKPKDLVGIPWRLAFALQDDGWWLRSEVIWDKANPMPESVEDRPSRSHEQVFLLTKSARYFYDFVAVREVAGAPTGGRQRAALRGESDRVGTAKAALSDHRDITVGRGGVWQGRRGYQPSRRNRRTVWKIASQPYDGAHFAVFPPDLVEPCILAGTSAHGCCSSCGAPWQPVNEKRSLERHELPHDHPEYRPARYAGKHENSSQRYLDVVTVDWKPGCDCAADVAPCVVLDPFMGAATTALVARTLGRRSIGIELSPEYARLAAGRLSQLSLLAEAASG